jgi:hypothetical protein
VRVRSRCCSLYPRTCNATLSSCAPGERCAPTRTHPTIHIMLLGLMTRTYIDMHATAKLGRSTGGPSEDPDVHVLYELLGSSDVKRVLLARHTHVRRCCRLSKSRKMLHKPKLILFLSKTNLFKTNGHWCRHVIGCSTSGLGDSRFSHPINTQVGYIRTSLRRATKRTID